MSKNEVIEHLKSLGDKDSLEGMVRFGIKFKECYGVRIPALRKLAGKLKKDHKLAKELWHTGVHDAMILATMIADPKLMTEEVMEKWVGDFYSWDICDQCCKNIFKNTSFAHKKAIEWTCRPEEYVKRAGFVLMCEIAVHDKKAKDEVFDEFFPIIIRESGDERNFVRKAVNWALRQIGKRNEALNRLSVETARKIGVIDAKSARWIAAGALRELMDEKSWYRWHKKNQNQLYPGNR